MVITYHPRTSSRHPVAQLGLEECRLLHGSIRDATRPEQNR